MKKSNQAIVKQLNGEYRAYAKKFISTVRSRCKRTRETSESISDVLMLLYDGQKNGRNFSDVIPSPNGLIHELISGLPPKRLRHIWLAALSLAAAIVCTVLAVVYVKSWSPITLQNPEVQYDPYTNMLTWEAVQHASAYEIYIDGELHDTVKYSGYGAGRLDKKDFTVYVAAKGEGRYRTGKNIVNKKVTVAIPKAEGSIADFLIDSHLGKGGEFCSFINMHTSIGSVYKQAEFILVPEYNFYGKVDTRSINVVEYYHNGKPATFQEEAWFIAGNEYRFIIEHKNKSETYINVFIDQRVLDTTFTELMPSGISLFATPSYEHFNEARAFESTASQLSFSKITSAQIKNKVMPDEYTVYLKSWFTEDVDNGCIVVKNSADMDISIGLRENVVNITTKERKAVTLKAGYASFTIDSGLDTTPFSNEEMLFVVYLPKSATIWGMALDTAVRQYVRQDSEGRYDFYYGRCHSDNVTTVFVEEDCEVIYECIEKKSSVSLSEEASFQIGLGLYWLKNPSKKVLLEGTNSFYMVYDILNPVFSSKLLGTQHLIPSNIPDTLVFNSGHEPITITIAIIN